MTIIGFIFLGIFAGIAASALGIGGGTIFVPTLVVLFSFAQQDAQGTSLAVIVPTAIIATVQHHRQRRVIWQYVIPIAAGGIVGAVAGSLTALSLDPALLRKLFATMLCLVSVRLYIHSRKRATGQ